MSNNDLLGRNYFLNTNYSYRSENGRRVNQCHCFECSVNVYSQLRNLQYNSIDLHVLSSCLTAVLRPQNALLP